jgi:hypothetical protein
VAKILGVPEYKTMSTRKYSGGILTNRYLISLIVAWTSSTIFVFSNWQWVSEFGVQDEDTSTVARQVTTVDVEVVTVRSVLFNLGVWH